MIDIFIVIVLLWAAWSGWRAGFLKELASMVGFLVGLLVAATCYSTLGQYLAVNGSETNMVTSIVAFLLLWIATPIVLGLVATLLTKALKGMKLGLPNSLLGMGLGLLKFSLLLSCIFNAMDALHILDNEKKEQSVLYAPLAGALQAFWENNEQATPANESYEQSDTTWVEINHTADTLNAK